VARIIAGVRLPTANDRVDVDRVELHSETAASHTLGGDHAGAAPDESIKYDLAARGAIEDGVCDQPHGFDGGMERQQVAFVAWRARARIAPDVGPVTAILTQENVVAVRRVAVLEDENQLMTAAI
jgi:hypothetical protein